MKRVILLLILITNCLWAKTWTQFLGGNNYFNKENDSITVVSSEKIMSAEEYLFFDSTLMIVAEGSNSYFLDGSEYFDAMDYFLINPSNSIACMLTMGSSNCLLNMTFYSKIEDNNSIWVQKNSGFLFNDSLDFQDTNFFIVPLMEENNHIELHKGFILEDYSISKFPDRLDSVYFIYKKDSSYYAYCLYTQSKKCRTFLFQCTFQDDGSTQFEPFETVEFPYPYYGPHKVDYSSSECMTKSEYEEYMPIPALPKVKKQNKHSTPYLVNGVLSESNHSKITIQNKQPKLQLKK